MNPLLSHPDLSAYFRPVLFGPVERYALMACYGTVVIDTSVRYDKRRKETHRFRIADTHGPVNITIPVEKPDHAADSLWRDIRVSRHGEWWHTVGEALRSAYGRTPFFEYLADPFLSLLGEPAPDTRVTDLCVAADRLVMEFLSPQTAVVTDLDVNVEPKVDVESAPPCIRPYWQIRADRFGFIPGLSVLDLIFNLGPEAPLYLR